MDICSINSYIKAGKNESKDFNQEEMALLFNGDAETIQASAATNTNLTTANYPKQKYDNYLAPNDQALARKGSAASAVTWNYSFRDKRRKMNGNVGPTGDSFTQQIVDIPFIDDNTYLSVDADSSLKEYSGRRTPRRSLSPHCDKTGTSPDLNRLHSFKRVNTLSIKLENGIDNANYEENDDEANTTMETTEENVATSESKVKGLLTTIFCNWDCWPPFEKVRVGF
jgi:hypothetical protein